MTYFDEEPVLHAAAVAQMRVDGQMFLQVFHAQWKRSLGQLSHKGKCRTNKQTNKQNKTKQTNTKKRGEN